MILLLQNNEEKELNTRGEVIVSRKGLKFKITLDNPTPQLLTEEIPKFYMPSKIEGYVLKDTEEKELLSNGEIVKTIDGVLYKLVFDIENNKLIVSVQNPFNNYLLRSQVDTCSK